MKQAQTEVFDEDVKSHTGMSTQQPFLSLP